MNRKAAIFGGGAVVAVSLLGFAVVGLSSPATPAAAPAPAAVSASASAVAPVPAKAPAPAAAPAPATTPAPVMAPAPVSIPTGAPATGGAGLGPLPVSVSIPSIKVKSSLIQLGLNPDGTVQVPNVKTPGQVGWYKYDARPGDVGAAVLLAHVDGGGVLGAFHSIGTLALGAEIDVARADGSTVKFSVTKVQTILKSAFPSDAVYQPTPDAELRLVTCGGAFNKATGNYVSSVIAYAKLM